MAAIGTKQVNETDGLARLLARSALFSGLPPAELAEPEAVARARGFEPRQKLFSEGERTEHSARRVPLHLACLFGERSVMARVGALK